MAINFEGLDTTFRARKRPSLLQVLKTTIAVALSWFTAQALLPQELPIFAAIAAIIVVLPSINQSFSKAIERSIGVIAGVLIATGVGLWLGNASWVVLLAVLLSLLVSWGMRMNSGASNQVAISAMLTLALGGASLDYSMERVLETLLGAAIGFAVNVIVVPPVRVEPARELVQLLGQELAAILDRIGDILSGGNDPQAVNGLLVEAKLLETMESNAIAAILAAEESLSLNPRRKRYLPDLQFLKKLASPLSVIVVQVNGMARVLYDNYESSLHEEPAIPALVEELRRCAHDLRLVLRRTSENPEPLTSELPALTMPIMLARPKGHHWILLGAFFEDLRRIREQIVAFRKLG